MTTDPTEPANPPMLVTPFDPSLLEAAPAALTQLLHTSATVVSVEVEAVGAGQTAQTERLTLRYAGDPEDAPATLIRKIHSDALAGVNLGAAGSLREKYVRELRFYEHLAANSGVQTPTCYGATLDAESGRFVLLLEDYAGQRFGKHGESGVEEIEAMVRSLAQMHAQTLGRLTPSDLPWLVDHDGFEAGLAGRYAQAMETFFERFGPHLSEAAATHTRTLAANARALVERLAAGPHALIHGDFHVENMVFLSSEPPTIALFDWQHVGWGVLTIDLTRCLVTTVPGLLDDAGEERLLRLYYERAGLAAELEFERLLELHRCTMLLIWMEMSEAYSQMTVEDIETYTRTDVRTLMAAVTAFLNRPWVATLLEGLGSASSTP